MIDVYTVHVFFLLESEIKYSKLNTTRVLMYCVCTKSDVHVSAVYGVVQWKLGHNKLVVFYMYNQWDTSTMYMYSICTYMCIYMYIVGKLNTPSKTGKLASMSLQHTSIYVHVHVYTFYVFTCTWNSLWCLQESQLFFFPFTTINNLSMNTCIV